MDSRGIGIWVLIGEKMGNRRAGKREREEGRKEGRRENVCAPSCDRVGALLSRSLSLILIFPVHFSYSSMDSDEETRGLVYQDIVEWGKEDERRATPSYASLRRAMTELGSG